ncbi:RNA-directed DNA polymerase, eukaryota [Tanacetum coccineum]
MESFSDKDVKVLWGNYTFEHMFSGALGNSGGILCVWDPNSFAKDNHIISDNFVALFRTWKPTKTKMILISVYAPQSIPDKRLLWNYLSSLITRWDGDSIVMGDFNEVRFVEERMGSVFNSQGASEFNSFINNSGLVDVHLEGYSFTWSHSSASKMSKLDRFLVTEGIISSFPYISAVCLDKHLSDHRPIILRDIVADYGATPFRFFNSWLRGLDGFGYNGFQYLEFYIGLLFDFKKVQSSRVYDINSKLQGIEVLLGQGGSNDPILFERKDLMNQLNDLKSSECWDYIQKAKIKWAIERGENSKFFHGVININRSNLAIKGVMVDGEWVDNPTCVKEEFRSHFASRFQAPSSNRCRLDFRFPKCLSPDQVSDLERDISNDEIRCAVWNYGHDKSPRPDGFTFDFFRTFWNIIGVDFCKAVDWFFHHHSFAKGCNSSFVTLIPKSNDPKFVSDYRPISLIGSIYKVVTKVLANRLSMVMSDLISDVQSAFLPSRQILDGPFIINELLSWCKHKKQQAMLFKVDFAKAYDSVSLNSGMASILVNGSPTSEFPFHCGLKQGDPLAPFLFILVMESLHLSFSRVVEAGLFKGIQIGSSLKISHLFYADDAVFIGEWSDINLTCIMQILSCFSLSSGLKINIMKSHLLGVGVPREDVTIAARSLGCLDSVIGKLNSRLSKWKRNTLSIGGRLTLLKSVLGSTPIYTMSLYKVPKSILHSMESIRRKFFYGANDDNKKITWVSWSKVLAAKEYGGLGVSSFYALNRGFLFKWVWRFLSKDNSLWLCDISPYRVTISTDSFIPLEKTYISPVGCCQSKLKSYLLSHSSHSVAKGFSLRISLFDASSRWFEEFQLLELKSLIDIRMLAVVLRPNLELLDGLNVSLPKSTCLLGGFGLDRLPTRLEDENEEEGKGGEKGRKNEKRRENKRQKERDERKG